MAETPLPPGAPGSPDPASSAGTPTEPAAEVLESTEAADSSAAAGPGASPAATTDDEPAVEGWSGTPMTVSTEEAIARPDAGTNAVSPTPAPAPSPEAAVVAASAAPAEPEPEPEPEPAPTPTIATTLEIPAVPGAATSEGGEFDLLIAKLRTWFAEADIAGHWQKLRGPLKGFALVLVAVLALRLYARVIGTLDGIPIVSGLLELTGLVYLLWFSSTRLLRTSERERVLADWKERWQSFSGRS
jgi:hypothetical protein